MVTASISPSSHLVKQSSSLEVAAAADAKIGAPGECANSFMGYISDLEGGKGGWGANMESAGLCLWRVF